MQSSKPNGATTPPRQVMLDVEELVSCWPDFFSKPEHYLSDYLPAILAHPAKATMRERLLISCIGSQWDIKYLISTVYERKKHEIVQKEIAQALGKFDFQRADSLNNTHQGCFPDYAIAREKAVQDYEQILLAKVFGALDRFELDEAARIYESYPNAQFKEKHAAQYASARDIALQNYENKSLWRIEEALKIFKFDEAARIFESVRIIDIRSKYQALVQDYRKRKLDDDRKQFVNSKIREIQICLQHYDFAKAAALYDLIRENYAEEEYRQLLDKYQKQQICQKKVAEIQAYLHKDLFAKADAAYLNSDILSEAEYVELKYPFVKKFVEKRFASYISDEKASALSDVNQNLLISARAGSGKTTVLAYKTAILIECYGLNPDDLLILAFNKKAASEIRGRIQKEMGIHCFENARTFHSLAYQLVKPEANLLFNDGTGEFSRPALSSFVQDLLRKIWTPDLQQKMYTFFRKEMSSVQYAGALLNDAEYYLYIRNQRDITLARERVKSAGEKYLADFLFEHDIPYAYESLEFWGGSNYRPDFSLYQHKITIEFWGIDENDPRQATPSWWDKSWKEYRAQMDAKRAYWRERGIPLIEFSIVDLLDGRDSFEAIIKTRLSEAGVICERLPQKVLESRVMRAQIDRITELLVQFIQKAKKRMWSPKEVQRAITDHQCLGEREHIFVQLASRIYDDYECALNEQNVMDFDDLLLRAASLIEESKGDCGISLGIHKDRFVKINDLKFILIDEYQDFSALFLNIIQAIRRCNPQVQLIAVGDDWQAINGFAGSDLAYFTNFNDIFPGGQTALLTNFRSQKAIVEGGNALMRDRGRPSIPLDNKQGGRIYKQFIDDVWIERREEKSLEEARKNDERFIFFANRDGIVKVADNGFVISRYLKACYQIIKEAGNWQRVTSSPSGKKDKINVAILSRTNYIGSQTLADFERKLHSCFTSEERKQLGDPREKIRVGTAHGFKGLEADIVIILRATEGVFPLIHPDNALFSLFGQTERDILDEERRLFYVAITRAAEKLYLLTEKDRESPFLKDLFLADESYL